MTLHDSGPPAGPDQPHVPHQSHPGRNGSGPHPPERRVPRNWKSYTIIGLLILIPAVYLVISALQSRDAGRDKAEKSDAQGLEEGWPSKVQRRVYGVPIPAKSKDVASYETNKWGTSWLFVEFTTTDKKLDKFMKKVGSDTDELRNGEIPITKKQADVVGWSFDKGDWYGVHVGQKGPKPELNIAVDLSSPKKPEVRVVSIADY
ncbi:sugar kinase [Streptomyces sp. A7024]|uniref:Sugar kinase n=1 Tax=Streptomyces coryli TaxID=1128680 RepID=A0A6G4U5C1_9ACTN|nr:sugar kinase [Streptomyces coryli]NGN66487.1 sugar kinase [Streptomyces coryli]